MPTEKMQVADASASISVNHLPEPAVQQLPRVEHRSLSSFVKKGRSILKTNDAFSHHRNQDVIKIENVQSIGASGTARRKGPTNDSSHDRLIINVSGARFETFKSTLEKYPDTLLGNKKRRRYYYDKIHDEYFFDRHRQAFEAIIYYYQSNGRLCRPISVPIDIFLEEMTFFDLGKEVLAQIRKEENLEEVNKTSLPRNRYRRYLWATLEYPEFSLIAKCVHVLSLLVIAASTVGLTVESLPQFINLASDACKGGYKQQNATKVVNSNSANLTSSTAYICLAYFTSPFVLVQTVCVGFFTLELILRVISMPSLCGFIKDPMNWIDVLAVVPFYVTVGLHFNGHQDNTVRNTYTGLQLLRVLRFTRILKFYRVFKSVKAIHVLALTLKEALPDFGILIAILTSIALLFGAAVYSAESSESTTKFDSIPVAIYWGIITITSVGYGDIAPTTPAGRVVACLCALSGTGTIAMLVSVLVDRYQRVFTRKLYIKSEQIDFDAYSDDDEATETKHGSDFLHIGDGIVNVEDQQEEPPRIEISKYEEATSDPRPFPLPDLIDRCSERISCIISYTSNDNNEESHKLIDKIRSVVCEKQFDLNDITLYVITDTPLRQSQSLHSQLSVDINTKNNMSGLEEVANIIVGGGDDESSEKSTELSSTMHDRGKPTTFGVILDGDDFGQNA